MSAKNRNKKTSSTPKTKEEVIVDKQPVETPAVEETQTVETTPPAEPPKAEKEPKKKPTSKEPEIPTAAAEEVPVKTDLDVFKENFMKSSGEKNTLDHNRTVDLMKMFKEEFLNDENPGDSQSLRDMAKTQYRVMLMNECLFYNIQAEAVYERLGIRVNKSMVPTLLETAKDIYNIDLKALPVEGNKDQYVLQFPKELPENLKAEAKKSMEKAEIPIPDPDPSMSLRQIEDGLSIILAKKNSIGQNLLNAMAWARIAFGISSEEEDSTVLARMLKEFPKMFGLIHWNNMVTARLHTDHSIIGIHAIAKSWLKTKSDEEIAKLVKVIVSSAQETKSKDWNERAPIDRKTDVNNEFILMNRNIATGESNSVLDAIIGNKENCIVDYSDGTSGKIAVNVQSIRKSLIAAYGDSESILKEILKKIPLLYKDPILRLANYVEKNPEYAGSKDA